MGEFKTECTACKGSFESEREFNGHKCNQVDNYHQFIKQEVFIEEDREENENETQGDDPLEASSSKEIIKIILEEKSKRNAKKKRKVLDIDPLSLKDDPLKYNADEEKPPGIDHETIRSLVLDAKIDKKEVDPSNLVNYGRQYSCRICHQLFSGCEEFTKHFKYDHKNYKPYECSICGKKFLQKHYVNLHMRVHTGEKPYKCSLCPRAYSHKTSFVIHMRIHNGERPFRCAVCGKRCYDKSGLTSHMRSHTKETPYHCKVCDRKFTHSKSLLVHHRNHTGEKPYTCQYCGKAFRHWHKHKIHVRLHTGERPYKCLVCGKGFPRNDEVNRHMKSHTGIKSFKCSICDVYCATQASITGHINLHHSTLKETEQPDKTLVTDSNSGILGKESISYPCIKSTLRNAPSHHGPIIQETCTTELNKTRVIEITSKDTPLPPPSEKAKNKKARQLSCSMPLAKTNDPDNEKPMNYQEFIEWQERMLAKQGLVVKRYPCNEENDKNSRKTQSNTKLSPTPLPSVSGDMLRKALTGNSNASTDDSDKQQKAQYVILSQPGNPNSKLLLPVNVTNLGAKACRPIAPLQPTLSNSSQIPPNSVENSDQTRPLLLVPQAMSSQSFILVQNGDQKMLLLAPQAAPTQATPTPLHTLPSNIDTKDLKHSIPALKIKMDPDPLPLQASATSSLLATSIKQEAPDELLHTLIKPEPEDD